MTTLGQWTSDLMKVREASSTQEAAAEKLLQVRCFVFGNSSADPDSIVSAVGLAFLLSRLWNGAIVVPVVNCPERDFLVRFEHMYVLEQAYRVQGAAELQKRLFFQDTPLVHALVTSSSPPSGSDTAIALVDHNYPGAGEQWPEWMLGRMRIIVDHHEAHDDSPNTPVGMLAGVINSWQGHGNFRLIAPTCVGSCASLIALLWQHFTHGKEDIPQCMAVALLAAVVKDCQNFNPALENDRWCVVDRHAFNYLQERALPIDGTALYKKLKEIRADWERYAALGMEALLVMDAKTYKYPQLGVVGYSTIPFPLDLLPGKFGGVEGVSAALERHRLERGFQAIILISGKTESHPRQLALYAPDENTAERLVSAVEKLHILELEKHPEIVCDSILFKLYNQHNESQSRKKFEPRLKASLSSECLV